MLGRGYSLVAVKVQKKANGRVKRFRMRLGSVARFVWIWLIAVSAVVSVGLLACETAEPKPIEPTRLPSATVAPIVRVEPTATQLPTVTPSPTVTPTATQTVEPTPTSTRADGYAGSYADADGKFNHYAGADHHSYVDCYTVSYGYD